MQAVGRMRDDNNGQDLVALLGWLAAGWLAGRR
jgi:hypothetical protein